ncbi:tellurite resistance protein TehB [Lacunisphaera limnophila]|uniref:Tellurite resistance protein TehB n=1 Tax=Lacunisphaera limnophila TaxID=1838286 RepID=A0A1D8ATF1_9BACT|nr:class I SAM-dependent methyltransferase [Lacunisphaera limnophila]AOS44140.1 tellurite resistance protein TehB [Lacunisphaera limnophila]
MKPNYDASFWDQRYGAATGYLYGTSPNEFLAAVADRIPPGPVLCLAEGEGRNAVHLARRGHAVTAVDQSATGLAKAAALAEKNAVPLTTIVADLADFPLSPGTWAGIVAIFMHLPPALRATVLARAVVGLLPGGMFVLECYSPAQLAFHTGGPREVTLLPTLATLRGELPGLEFLHGDELERDIIEGDGHTGRGAVVQVLARRPA